MCMCVGVCVWNVYIYMYGPSNAVAVHVILLVVFT